MKQFVAVLAVMLISGVAAAQHRDTPAPLINIGLRAGINCYTINNKSDIEKDPIFGFHFGWINHIHLNKSFAVQPGIVYSTQGTTYMANNEKINYHLNYFNVPVLFQYMFDNGIRLQAGPQGGFLFDAKAKTSDSEQNRRGDIKHFELALSMGAGYAFPRSGLGIDIRYNHGLTYINRYGKMDSTNRGFQLGLFYIYNNK